MTVRSSVSVVIPCYNASAFLRETIASVRAQTRIANEVIVVDDASTDNSVSIAEAEGVRMVRMKRNGGVAMARNAGIDAATGDFVAFLDADDRWRPLHLETLLPLLEQHEDAALAFGLLKSFGVSNETQELRIPPNIPFDAFMQLYTGGDICIPSSMVVRRAAALTLGGFRKSQLGNAEDYDFTLRLAEQYGVIGSPVVVGDYRKTGHGLSTSRKANREAEFESRFLVLERARADNPGKVVQLEEGLRKALRWRFETAWSDRDAEMMRHYAALGKRYVPGSEPLLDAWGRKARLLPFVRVLDHVPMPVARFVRTISRRITG